MKKLFSIILSLSLVMPFLSAAADISMQSPQQAVGTIVLPKELYTAIEELNKEQFTTILTSMGPLSKENNALPLVELYKMRNSIESALVGITSVRVCKEPLSESFLLGVVGGGGIGLVLIPFMSVQLNKVNSSLWGAYLGAMLYGLYTVRRQIDKKKKELDQIKAIVMQWRKKREIVDAMIQMLENHPEA